ncbi:MAG: hypothetical protein KJI71_05415 [Patescibacteria group bacterium]|nr:hypothetical protein [Patescibacteria group bacterium]
MKVYHLIPSERGNYCVCSVLQAIFKGHGIEISQDEIAGRLTPITERAFYVDDENMDLFMLEMGFDYTYFPHNATPFNEPDMLLGEMIENHGFLGVNNHAYLLENFKDPELTLINPEDGSRTRKHIRDMLVKMRKGKGGFGLIKKLD